MPPPTWVDVALLSEFEADARQGFARLLGALQRGAHPKDAPGPAPTDSAKRALEDLAASLATARALATDSDLRSRFPLAETETVRCVLTLLGVVAYSSAGSRDVFDKLDRMVRRLSATAATPDPQDLPAAG
jgi:hypothetical protein